MLSLVSNGIVLLSGLIALATLASSWLRFRPCWEALDQEIAAGPPVHFVSVTIRNTSVAPQIPGGTETRAEIIYPARFAAKPAPALNQSPALHAAA